MPVKEYETKKLRHVQVPQNPGLLTWVVTDELGAFLASFSDKAAAQIYWSNHSTQNPSSLKKSDPSISDFLEKKLPSAGDVHQEGLEKVQSDTDKIKPVNSQPSTSKEAFVKNKKIKP